MELTPNRCELLVAPIDAIPHGALAELEQKLAECIDDAVALRFQSASFRLSIVLPEVDVPVAFEAKEGFSLREGRWPEPLGLELDIRGSSWTLSTDFVGYRPAFYGRDTSGRLIASTRPDAVAALLRSALSVEKAAEGILLGFDIDATSVFEGIERLQPDACLMFGGDRKGRVTQKPREEPEIKRGSDRSRAVRLLSEAVAHSFHTGYALELSGGIDSRLVLALGLHAGAKPDLAITLGSESSEDAAIAREICRLFGIQHHLEPFRLERERIVADGRRFVAASGCQVNASYSVLPATLRALDGVRSAQIGGQGGELATGFYYTPLDFICLSEPLKRAWIRGRVFRPGSNFGIFGGRSADLRYEVERKVLERMELAPGSWREKSDLLYSSGRMRSWAAPVLSASNCYYRSHQPFLGRSYLEWARSLRSEERAGRTGQLTLIEELAGSLLNVRLEGTEAQRSGIAKRYRGALRTLRKTSSRLTGRRRPPDLGEIDTVAQLIRVPEVEYSVRRVSEVQLEVQTPELERMFESPRLFEHELGVLISCAWAAESVQGFADILYR